MRKFKSFWQKNQKSSPRPSVAGQGRPLGSNTQPAPSAGAARPGRHRKASRRILLAITLLLLMLMVWGISALAGSLIKVRSVEVVGDSSYSVQEIISSTGIEVGSRLNKIDKRGVERDLLQKLTYLSGVQIKTRLFGRVKISVKSDAAAYYTEIAGEYYALSGDFRLLEKGGASDFMAAGLIFISLPKIKTAILGGYVAYYDAADGFVAELMEELEASELFSGTSEVDASDRYAISMKYDRFLVKIGSYQDIGLKFRIASQMTKDDVLKSEVNAILDVSDPANATIRFK